MTWDATLTTWDVAVALRCPMREVWRLVEVRRLPAAIEHGCFRFRQIDVDQVRRT